MLDCDAPLVHIKNMSGGIVHRQGKNRRPIKWIF